MHILYNVIYNLCFLNPGFQRLYKIYPANTQELKPNEYFLHGDKKDQA